MGLTEFFLQKSEEEEIHEEEEENEHTDDIILVLFVSLLIGMILKQINKKFKFPYTPLLIIIGLILGITEKYTGILGDAINVWNNISPHGILLIFIPPLIFESGFNADWHIFKREIWQILLLAGPGVVFSALLTAVVFKYILMYENFSFTDAFMFGSIMSATDPVAVVALLKELGVSKRFSTLIEGESLVNDGTAMVLYMVLITFVKGEEMSGGMVFGQFIRLSFGAVALGIVAGWLVGFWLERLFNDAVLTLALTLSSAYLLFYAAEMTPIRVSGVLTVVAFGLYMSQKGKIKISSFDEQAIHSFWTFAGFVAETMIFVTAGIVVGDQIFFKDRDYTSSDWGKMFAFYALLHIVRFIVIVCMWPLLRITGYGLNFKQILVLVYGGLRGAVGLALALLVTKDPKVPEYVRDEVLFHMAGIAILTILINGNTTGFLVNYLKLSEVTPIQKRIISYILTHFLHFSTEKMEELKKNKYYGLVDWELVNQMVHLEQMKKAIMKSNHIEFNKEDEVVDIEKVIDSYDISEKDQETEARHRFLTTLKGCFWQAFEEGQVSGIGIEVLKESADRALDYEDKELTDWMFIQTYMTSSTYFKFMRTLSNLPLIGRFFNKAMFYHSSMCYELAVNFLEGHELARNLIENVVDPGVLRKIQAESTHQTNQAENYLEEIAKIFPEISSSLQSKRAAYYVLIHQKAYCEHLAEMGEIDDREAGILHELVMERMYRIHLKRARMIMPNTKDWVISYGIFRTVFSIEELKEITAACEEKEFAPQYTMMKAGENPKYVYAIVRGAAQEKVPQNTGALSYESIFSSFTELHGMGQALGLQYVLHSPDKFLTNAVSHSLTMCLPIPIGLIKDRLSETKIEKIWRVIAPLLFNMYADNFKPLMQLKSEVVSELLEQSRYAILAPGRMIDLTSGLLLLQGEGQEIENKEAEKEAERKESRRYMPQAVFKACAFVFPSDIKIKTLTKSTVFYLPRYLSRSWMQSSFYITDMIIRTQERSGGFTENRPSIYKNNLLRQRITTRMSTQSLAGRMSGRRGLLGPPGGLPTLAVISPGKKGGNLGGNLGLIGDLNEEEKIEEVREREDSLFGTDVFEDQTPGEYDDDDVAAVSLKQL